MAKPEDDDIRVFLAELREVLLDAGVNIKVVELEDMEILQMVEFSSNKLTQENKSLLFKHFVHQLCIDEPMNIGFMCKAIACFTQIFEALKDIK